MEPQNRYKFLDNKEQHLHTLDMVPLLGTSTVVDILGKTLTYWASGMAVVELGVAPDAKVLTKIKNKTATPEEIKICMDSVALKLEEIKQMDSEKYFKLLDKAYRAHASNLKKTAKDGKDLHKELELYVKFCLENNKGVPVDTTEFDPKIEPYIKWSLNHAKRFLFSEAHTYSEKYWIGGIVDCGIEFKESLYTDAEGKTHTFKDGEVGIVDFKSSDKAYNSQFYQIGGYNIEITENGVFDANGNFIMKLDKPITRHIVVPFRSDPVLPVVSADTVDHTEAFLACLVLYKKENKFVN